MTLGFDIDGVLADFNTAYGNLFIKTTGVDRFPAGWNANPPDYPDTWYWDRQAGYTKEEEAKVWNEHILVDGKFWHDLEPMPGVRDSLTVINRLAKTHEVYFLTNRMGFNAKQQTEQWLANRGIHYPTVLLTGDKVPVLKSLGVTAFIDDKPETINACVTDPALFAHCQVFVKDAGYNRQVRPEATRVADVATMLGLLLGVQ